MQIPQKKVPARICAIRGIRERDFFRFLHADLGCCPDVEGEVLGQVCVVFVRDMFIFFFRKKFKHISKICLSRNPIVI